MGLTPDAARARDVLFTTLQMNRIEAAPGVDGLEVVLMGGLVTLEATGDLTIDELLERHFETMRALTQAYKDQMAKDILNGTS